MRLEGGKKYFSVYEMHIFANDVGKGSKQSGSFAWVINEWFPVRFSADPVNF